MVDVGRDAGQFILAMTCGGALDIVCDLEVVIHADQDCCTETHVIGKL